MDNKYFHSSRMSKGDRSKAICIILFFIAAATLFSYKLLVSPIVPEMWIWKQNVNAEYMQINPFGPTHDSYEDNVNEMSYFPVSYYPMRILSVLFDVDVHTVSRFPLGILFVCISFVVLYSLFGSRVALISAPFLAFGPINLVYIGSAFNNSIIALSFYPLIFLTLYAFLKNEKYNTRYFLAFMLFFFTMYFAYHTSAFIMSIYFFSFAIILTLLAIIGKEIKIRNKGIFLLALIMLPIHLITYLSGFNLMRVISLVLDSLTKSTKISLIASSSPYSLVDLNYRYLLIMDFIIYAAIGLILLFKLSRLYSEHKNVENIFFLSIILSTIPISVGLILFGMPERILEHTVFPIVFSLAFLLSRSQFGTLTRYIPIIMISIFVISALALSTTHVQKIRQYSTKDSEFISWYGNLNMSEDSMLLSDLRMGFPLYGFTGRPILTLADTYGRLTSLIYYEVDGSSLYDELKSLNMQGDNKIKYVLYNEKLFDDGVITWDFAGEPASHSNVFLLLNNNNFDKIYSSGEKYFVLEVRD